MSLEKLISCIDIALLEADNLVKMSNFYTNNTEPIKSTKYVLKLLLDEASADYEHINDRVLRAMHDIGMSSYKDFENTPMEDALINVTTVLYNDIHDYKYMQPLRMDFGKGNPI